MRHEIFKRQAMIGVVLQQPLEQGFEGNPSDRMVRRRLRPAPGADQRIAVGPGGIGDRIFPPARHRPAAGVVLQRLEDDPGGLALSLGQMDADQRLQHVR